MITLLIWVSHLPTNHIKTLRISMNNNKLHIYTNHLNNVTLHCLNELINHWNQLTAGTRLQHHALIINHQTKAVALPTPSTLMSWQPISTTKIMARCITQRIEIINFYRWMTFYPWVYWIVTFKVVFHMNLWANVSSCLV